MNIRCHGLTLLSEQRGCHTRHRNNTGRKTEEPNPRRGSHSTTEACTAAAEAPADSAATAAAATASTSDATKPNATAATDATVRALA